MKDFHWHIPPDKAKALMLAKRQLAELVCDAVNLPELFAEMVEQADEKNINIMKEKQITGTAHKH